MTPEEMSEYLPEGRFQIDIEVDQSTYSPKWRCRIISDEWVTVQEVDLQQGMDEEILSGEEYSYFFNILPGQMQQAIRKGVEELIEAECGENDASRD